MPPRHDYETPERHDNADTVLPEYTEEKRRFDRAAPLVMALRDVYSHLDPNQRLHMMERFDGVKELTELVEAVREGHNPDSNELLLVKYMNDQAKNVLRSAYIDWVALEGGEDSEEPVEKTMANIDDIMQNLQVKIAATKADEAEADVARMEAQLQYLAAYRHLWNEEDPSGIVGITVPGSVNNNDAYTAEEYMIALRSMQSSGTDEAKREFEAAKKLLETRDKLFFIQSVAMEAIWEHAPEFRNEHPEVADEMDARFVYQDTRPTSDWQQKKRNRYNQYGVYEDGRDYPEWTLAKGVPRRVLSHLYDTYAHDEDTDPYATGKLARRYNPPKKRKRRK